MIERLPVMGMRCNKCSMPIKGAMILPPFGKIEALSKMLKALGVYCLCDTCLEGDPEFFPNIGTDTLI